MNQHVIGWRIDGWWFRVGHCCTAVQDLKSALQWFNWFQEIGYDRVALTPIMRGMYAREKKD